MSWKVLFMTKVCQCPYVETERRRLLQISAVRNVLPCFEYSFKDQKATIMLFGGFVTFEFVSKLRHDYENDTPSTFWRKFSAN